MTEQTMPTFGRRLAAAKRLLARPEGEKQLVRVTHWPDGTEPEETAVGFIVSIDEADESATVKVFMPQRRHDQYRWAAAVAAADANDLMTVVFGLQEAVQQEANARAAAETRDGEFRAQVREVAIRVAEEQGWCDEGLNEVLEELDLEKKMSLERQITVDVRLIIRGTVDEANAEKVADDTYDTDWIKESLNLSMDGDWSDESIEIDDFTVVEVEDQ